MKTIFVCVIAVALASGCGPKKKPIQQAEPAAPTMPESALTPDAAPSPAALQPGQTTVPITGAFGWRLGEKIPHPRHGPSFTLYSDNANTNTPPFVRIEVTGLMDGTIWKISGDIDDPLQEDAVKAALESKYGACAADHDGFGSFWLWKNGDGEIRLRTGRLEYSDRALAKKSQDEYETSLHQSGAALAPKL
jgi:hypothetical protein